MTDVSNDNRPVYYEIKTPGHAPDFDGRTMPPVGSKVDIIHDNADTPAWHGTITSHNHWGSNDAYMGLSAVWCEGVYTKGLEALIRKEWLMEGRSLHPAE